MTRRHKRDRRDPYDLLPIPLIVFLVAPLLATIVLGCALVVGYVGALLVVYVHNLLIY